MDLNLRGRKALVTGASKGIGYATAHCLATEGCDVVLVSRTAADLEAARQRIAKETNVAISVEPRDMSDSKNALALAQKYPDLDIVVNNAGAIPGGSVEDVEEARWRTAWDLKVFGYINLTRAYFARMKERRRGVIINIIGLGGEKLDFNDIAGGMANASLMAFSRALGGTSPGFGVRVLGVNPGPVLTERIEFLNRQRAAKQFGDENRWQENFAKMPFGRPATPDEIAAMVVFLASDLSSYTSGSIVTIDGGLAHRAPLAG